MDQKPPPNELGVFAIHSRSDRKLTDEEMMAFINGPIAAVQEKMREEIQKEYQAKEACPCGSGKKYKHCCGEE